MSACNRRGPKLTLEIRNICHVYTSLVFPVTLGVTFRCPCLSEDNSVLISGGLEGLSTSRAGTNVWMQRAQRFHGSCGDFRLDSGSGGFSDPSYVSSAPSAFGKRGSISKSFALPSHLKIWIPITKSNLISGLKNRT